MSDAFFDLASDFMAVSPVGLPVWTAINPAFAARLGLSPNDSAPLKLPHPENPSRLVASDGSYVLIDWTIHEEGGSVYWVGRERATSMVRELHHRFKNNLQFLVSLLSFQSARLDDTSARAHFATAESRIRAVARLHEITYSAPDFSEVEFGAYLRELVRHLSAGAGSVVTISATEAALAAEQALPLAVIAHELVSDALQNADGAAIAVTLDYDGEQNLRLITTVDGIESEEENPQGDPELVAIFVGQLQGSLQSTLSGTRACVSVTFPLAAD